MKINRGIKRIAELGWRRKGSVLVLSAFCLILVMGFTAFVVDVGYISLTRAQLQNAADSGAYAAALELPDGLGTAATENSGTVDTEARAAAVLMASLHRAGDQDSVFADSVQDVRLGQLQWNAGTGTWDKLWGTTPYNVVEVTVRRVSANQAGPLGLFFAPIIGHQSAEITVTSTAALAPGNSFRVEASSSATADILPIALDWDTWNLLITTDLADGLFPDDYTVDPVTGAVTPGGDGVMEINLYPEGSTSLPPGNRGTVDFGSSNNSTADLSRQILNGLNASDFSYFPNNTISASVDNPLIVNGDTGLSAGIKDELTTIIGQPRAIPVFTEVSGPGNNAMYTVVKFVGVRILDVQLTGCTAKKHVTIQPTTFVGKTIVRNTETVTSDSILSSTFLVP